MKLRWIFFLLFSFSLFNSAYAASNFSGQYESRGIHGIGISTSVFGLAGFSYRHYMPSKIGFVGNIGGWLTEGGGSMGIATGLSYSFAHHYFPDSVLPDSSLRIYGIGYLAGMLRHARKEESVVDDKIAYKKEGFFDVGLGIGPGGEYFFTKNFAAHIELPWMTFIKIGKKTSFKSSYPHLGIGASYYF